MKRLRVLLILALTSSLLITSCGKGSGENGDSDDQSQTPNIIVDDVDPTVTEAPEDPAELTEAPEEETRDGYIRSDLTNEWIDESLANMRPLAVMVPDNKSALPHYNISNAGVIYECLAEGKISRLLCVWDDWHDLERIGNIRSARAYYVYWALEWDSIYCHFGNVFYADPIMNIDACDNIDGNRSPYGYFRVTNEGRIHEQTAYGNGQDLIRACEYYNYSLTHTEYYTPRHWQFTDNDDLSGYSDAMDCTYIDCRSAFPDDKPYFEYNAEDGLYYRYQFGEAHMDAATNTQLAFKNVLIQYCNYTVLDQYDHLEYSISAGNTGYYITNGQAIPVTWKKNGDLAPTRFYDSNGNEIYLNTGKTMVCVVGTGSTVTLQ